MDRFMCIVYIIYTTIQFSSVQSLNRVQLFATPWIAACQASRSITNSWSSLRLVSIESVMPSSHLILGRPIFLLPPTPPSIKVFSNESTLCMRCLKYWSFSFSIIPSKEIPGLISFRMDWLDLLAVQGTLKSLLQHHSSKVPVLWRSAFFMVASLIAQRLIHLPAMRETWVWSPGWEDPLEKEKAAHSSTFAWKMPLTEKPGRLQSVGSQRVVHDWATSVSFTDFFIVQ